ncbi:MAG: saccharopine dehydrogenase family protein [Solirubrobacteraceae bacterium]
MSGRIVLFGATGFTGRLTAEALVREGAKPVLAARSGARLAALCRDLGGGLETAEADVSRPRSVRDLVDRGDVLVSTVGPFARWGEPAVQAAVASGAHYLDSTGEPPFIRAVFERYGLSAEAAGCSMVTAFGYDWVPGNLAGALALREAGDEAVRVDIGYFLTGEVGPSGMSGGTRASLMGVLLESSFAFRGGALRTERPAARVRSFDVRGHSRQGVSVGSSEHFALPRLHPSLRDVDVYLGWFGSLSRGTQAFSTAGSILARLPGTRRAFATVSGRLVKSSSGGPEAAARAKSGSHIVAVASGPSGDRLGEVHLEGIDAYSFTGRMLAWGACHVLAVGLEGTGALGPVEAFGLDELERGCVEAGIERA